MFIPLRKLQTKLMFDTAFVVYLKTTSIFWAISPTCSIYSLCIQNYGGTQVPAGTITMGMQINDDANKSGRDASKNSRDASKNRRDASKNRRDASKNSRDASKKRRDASKDRRDASKNSRDASKNRRDASKKRRDASKKSASGNASQQRPNVSIRSGGYRITSLIRMSSCQQ